MVQLSRSDFERGLQQWLAQTEKESSGKLGEKHWLLRDIIRTKWRWASEPFTGYGYLEQLDKQITGSARDPAYEWDLEEHSITAEEPTEEDDEASAPTDARPVLFASFYVVYSTTYRVPVLYFRARNSGGTQVELQQLLASNLFYNSATKTYPFSTIQDSDGSSNETDTRDDTLASFPAISQGEHPLTSLPCYFLHPCETSAVLDEMLGSENDGQNLSESPVRVVESWFSLVKSIVDIR